MRKIESLDPEGKKILRRKKVRNRVSLILIVLATVASFYFIPGLRKFFKEATALLSSGDTAALKQYVLSYGAWAAGISFLLMMLQSLIAPIPAFLITFTNAALFGWVKGAALSWTSAMAGALMCFIIARVLGRDIVVKITSEAALKSMDSFFEKHGKLSILTARLLPFVPFDIVSYAAGLTSIGTLSFLTATGLGQLPATLIYSYAGEKLAGSQKILVTALLVITAGAGIFFLIKQMKEEKKEKNEKSEVLQSESNREKTIPGDR